MPTQPCLFPVDEMSRVFMPRARSAKPPQKPSAERTYIRNAGILSTRAGGLSALCFRPTPCASRVHGFQSVTHFPEQMRPRFTDKCSDYGHVHNKRL